MFFLAFASIADAQYSSSPYATSQYAEVSATNTGLSSQAVLYGNTGPYPTENPPSNGTVPSSAPNSSYSAAGNFQNNTSTPGGVTNSNAIATSNTSTPTLPYGNISPANSNISPANANAAASPAGTGLMANDFGDYSAYANGSGTSGIGATSTNDYVERVLTGEDAWSWQILPTGLLYKSYLAGPYEGRMGSRWDRMKGEEGLVWNATLGASFGLFRYGTANPILPQGWQVDMEGAAFPRLDSHGNVVGNDYTFALPLTTRQGNVEWKFGYRHYCSHIADEYLLLHPGFPRINYVRDSIFTGMAYYLNPSLRIYGEAGYGFYCDDGAQPWEFQFGIDWSSPAPTTKWGLPFFAINTHLRQENDYGGNFTVEAGWQWRGETGRLFRLGAHYFNGKSEQCQFYKESEEQIGFGAWYDF
jgi:hypothetical protein